MEDVIATVFHALLQETAQILVEGIAQGAHPAFHVPPQVIVQILAVETVLHTAQTTV